MEKKIEELIEENDLLLIKLKEKLSLITDQLIDLMIILYIKKLKSLNEEDLSYEWSERIGDELREFDWYINHQGRDKIENILVENYRIQKIFDLEVNS